MIQKTSARHISSAITSPGRPPPPNGNQENQQRPNDGLETWGKWIDSRYYSLEVIQHPLRARMCGFGDKDRRPLAPAAVARLVIRTQDGSIVDVNDVDFAFFIVTVDLWSADGKREMNLVLHPSSADRYIPTQASKPRRRPTLSGSSAPRPPQSPGPQNLPGPTSFPLRPVSDAPVNHSSPPASNFPQSTFQFPDTFQFAQPAPYPANWPYPHAPPGTPYPPREAWHPDAVARGEPDVSPFRGWDPSQPHIINPSHHAQPPSGDPNRVAVLDPTLRTPGDSSGTSPPSDSTQPPREQAEGADWHSSTMHAPSHPPGAIAFQSQVRYGAPDAFDLRPPPPPVENAIYGHPPFGPPQTFGPNPPLSPPPSAGIALPNCPKHTYTRTLVGPLSANASRLLDEHRKPGIFFLFQDLSIRTEGNFRLRLRLMNVGERPAPSSGATRIHNDVSPVLAQTFTEPFAVYSAKRFPGVPDTTALSIAFGNQGQKLPLRNRHGTSKPRPGPTRRRDQGQDDSGSEVDSD